MLDINWQSAKTVEIINLEKLFVVLQIFALSLSKNQNLFSNLVGNTSV